MLVACASQPKRPAPPPEPAPPPPTALTPPAPAVPPHKITTKPAVPKSESPAKETNSDTLPAADVGYYLDVLQGRLRQLSDPAMVVSRGGERIVLDVSRHFSFNEESVQIETAERERLLPLSKALVEYRMTRVTIAVRSQTNEAAGMKLAKSRAQSIARFLSESGIVARRIVVAEPMSPNAVGIPDKNVVVEIQLTPIVRTADTTP